jgi:hypothetical protein
VAPVAVAAKIEQRKYIHDVQVAHKNENCHCFARPKQRRRNVRRPDTHERKRETQPPTQNNARIHMYINERALTHNHIYSMVYFSLVVHGGIRDDLGVAREVNECRRVVGTTQLFVLCVRAVPRNVSLKYLRHFNWVAIS